MLRKLFACLFSRQDVETNGYWQMSVPTHEKTLASGERSPIEQIHIPSHEDALQERK